VHKHLVRHVQLLGLRRAGAARTLRRPKASALSSAPGVCAHASNGAESQAAGAPARRLRLRRPRLRPRQRRVASCYRRCCYALRRWSS
jgi:hypothetical protein